MSKFEKDYQKLLIAILREGLLSSNRTGIDTYKLFNQNINIDLQEGFPILTGKKVYFDKGLAEFRWIYEGKTDIKYLNDRNVKWWNGYNQDDLGKVYGYQVKSFNGVFDQIKYVIKEINNNTRRAVITLWNPCDFNEQVIPCCYTQFNFVKMGDTLNMVMHFRSSDVFLGLPYDIIVGALFLYSVAKETNLKPSMLGLSLADAHIYNNQVNSVEQYLHNEIYELPELLGDYDNYSLTDYTTNKFIKTNFTI